MDNLAESLDAFLYQDVSAEAADIRFVIDTDKKANWAVKMANQYQQRIDDAKKQADQIISETNAWLEEEIERNQDEVNFFLSMLRPYAESKLIGKSKTVKFPNGNIQFKSQSPVLYVGMDKADANNLKLLEYVKKSAPDYLKIKESVEWGEFKKALKVTDTGKVISSDGEIIEFMRGEIRPDTIAVKERKNDEKC